MPVQISSNQLYSNSLPNMANPCSLAERLLISSPEEVQSLATQLADDYIEYFDIDINHEQECFRDSVEECLAHLEEVLSALDNYKQSSEAIDDFVGTVASKEGSLKKLFDQVDAIEQYAFETNRLLDHLDGTMKELERHQSSKDGKIKQLLHMIPGVSNIPRLGFFSALGGLVNETPAQDFVENPSNEADDQQLMPMDEILDELKNADANLVTVTTNLQNRLYGMTNVKPAAEVHEPMATLSLDVKSPENEDGSWQELL